MALPQPVITHQMVLAELVKAGINRDIADDLAYRYYKNELTYKDLELIKLELKSDIMSVKNELDKKIDSVENNLNHKINNKFNELDKKIDSVQSNLNTKIDNKFNELDKKIDNVEHNLNNKIDTVKNELKSDIHELDKKIDTVKNEITLVKKDMSNLEKTNKWIFGLTFALWITVLGGFIALILK